MTRRQVVALILFATSAGAVPLPNTKAPSLRVEDLAGGSIALTDDHVVTLVIYEDQKAGTQNQKVRDRIGPITDRPENRDKLRLLAVADLERWDFWPAKKYVIEDLHKISKKENTPIYCDWKGRVRREWGLTRGRSGVILLDTHGIFRFAAEGPLDDGQIEQLVARLSELGVH